MTDAFVFKEPIHTDTIGTRGRFTKVHLDVTPLPGEAVRAVATEIMDEIGTVGIQQARDVSTVVYVNLAKTTLPARLTLTTETSLFQRYADGVIITRVALLRARVNSDVTVGACVTRTAQTFVRVPARVVLAHGTVRTGILHTLSFLILALQATVALLTVAAVTLRKVNTDTTVEAWL